MFSGFREIAGEMSSLGGSFSRKPRVSVLGQLCVTHECVFVHLQQTRGRTKGGQNSESLKLTQEIPIKVEEKGKTESHLTDDP